MTLLDNAAPTDYHAGSPGEPCAGLSVCRDARTVTTTGQTPICGHCGLRVDRRDGERTPPSLFVERHRPRAKKKRGSRGALRDGERTFVNAPPLGHHPATLPRRTWW